MFAILDGIENEEESQIEELFGDSDTEFVSEEIFELSVSDNHNLLVPEANVNIVANDEPNKVI